jgi:replicative superfamily II helicase
MNEEKFRQYMQQQRRSQGTMDSCVGFTLVFEEYLNTHCGNIPLDEAQPEELDAFLDWGKVEIGSMNSYLWAISRYYEYTGNKPMHRYSNQLRKQAIAKKRSKRPSLSLKTIQGVRVEDIEALKRVGINNGKQLLQSGSTPNSRLELSQKTGIHLEEITELVKIADLCRISDIKGVRVRLLYDTGFDSLEKIAAQDPEEMRLQITKVNERDKITPRHPTLVETKFWVEQAKSLPRLVEY